MKKPLLINALDCLTAIGITEIGIVIGHMADYIKTHIGNKWNGANISYYENPRYYETNKRSVIIRSIIILQ